MKRFFKFLLGLAVVAAAITGFLYFLKNILMKDYLEDFDDDDFDNDLYDDERDYVTLTPDSSTEEKNPDSDESAASNEESSQTEELIPDDELVPADDEEE